MTESGGDLSHEAEQQVAEAEARAEAARARAEELRRQLEGLQAQAPEAAARTAPTLRIVAASFAAVMTAALLSATGYMLWRHHNATQQHREAAEYTAAARQGVINLMSVDYTNAKDTVQRVIEGSTGRFRNNFEETADDFVKALQQEKIITRARVNDAAVESMTGDSAVVLISATSQREGADAPKSQQQPRVWRVVVTVQREGGQVKLSGVEFV